ncbi:MAG: penicillin-binding protein activator [Alphaproteobacteria bacterium]
MTVAAPTTELAPSEIPAPAAASAVILTPPPGVRPRVRVGLLLPLTGPEAAVGKSMLDAAQLAVFDVAEQDFVLVPRDTFGTPEGAREAAIAALEDGAKLLLGPLFATSVAAVAPLARAAHVNVVAFSNDRNVASPETFVMGLLPAAQIHRVVSYAGAQGIRRYAALVPDTPFGRRVADTLQAAAVRYGGVVTQVESYGPGQNEASLAVRRLAGYRTRRAALLRQRALLEGRPDEVSRQALSRIEGLQTLGHVGFDAVLLPVSGAQLKSIAPLLPFYDIDPKKVRLLGMADWHEPGLGREPALAGAWFAAPPPDSGIEFRIRYRRMYGNAPHKLGFLAYDAVALSAVLASVAGGPNFGAEALAAQNGFAGMGGIFRLVPNGLVQRGLAVLQVEANGFKVISPPRVTFEDLSN